MSQIPAVDNKIHKRKKGQKDSENKLKMEVEEENQKPAQYHGTDRMDPLKCFNA